MRKIFVAVGCAIAVVSAASLASNDARAMSGAYGAGVLTGADQASVTEQVACWWSRRLGRTVCGGPVVVAPVAPVVVAPVVVRPRVYYRHGWRRW